MDIPHDYFGKLEMDERLRQHRAVMDFLPNQKVSVTIDWTGISPRNALTRARDICDRIRVRELEYRASIAQDLLPVYLRTWSHGKIINADGFMNRVSLAEIHIVASRFGHPDCAHLIYADNGLFAGNSIELSLDADFNYGSSRIAIKGQ